MPEFPYLKRKAVSRRSAEYETFIVRLMINLNAKYLEQPIMDGGW